jgi:hypothetical protein
MTRLIDSSLNKKPNRNIFLFADENIVHKDKILILHKYNKFIEQQLITKKRKQNKTKENGKENSIFQIKLLTKKRISYLENYLLS